MTKKGFAEVLGVTPHTVLRYESGEISPSPETLEQSARFARPGQRRIERSPGYNPHTSPVCGSGFCGPMPRDIHRPEPPPSGRLRRLVLRPWLRFESRRAGSCCVLS
ncbi:helix-turn-helix domain-containing protein [Rhizobium leguminosarum bv. viciae]|nr:helix-turn-helix domain-containing protein [Rhizobium leguminosarum bv. viciae]TCA26560.1 helix-turn-helix domain-containing protein [Rhizobium leguminosarum bv. viciae]TCA62385.1 helix-turn-helix domain-containing protein [Rhizobium leguminosarum bv. viciae]